MPPARTQHLSIINIVIIIIMMIIIHLLLLLLTPPNPHPHRTCVLCGGDERDEDAREALPRGQGAGARAREAGHQRVDHQPRRVVDAPPEIIKSYMS
jgi:hypothetical protein